MYAKYPPMKDFKIIFENSKRVGKFGFKRSLKLNSKTL